MKVKIKTWKKMEKEFGIAIFYDNEYIKCDNDFIYDMELQMPKNRVIDISLDNENKWFWNYWIISNDMIEKYY